MKAEVSEVKGVRRCTRTLMKRRDMTHVVNQKVSTKEANSVIRAVVGRTAAGNGAVAAGEERKSCCLQGMNGEIRRGPTAGLVSIETCLCLGVGGHVDEAVLITSPSCTAACRCDLGL